MDKLYNNAITSTLRVWADEKILAIHLYFCDNLLRSILIQPDTSHCRET
jgi:hypothetical protein